MAKAPRKRVPGQQGTSGRASARPVPRSGAARGAQERALADVTHVLEAIEHPSAIIGGIAVIAWGFARFTADIDCAIAASSDEIEEILSQFERGGFEARVAEPAAFAAKNLVLLLRHQKTGVELDASLAQLGFEGEALRGAVVKRFGGVKIRVPSLTDLLIYKMVAGRPRDQQDVEELLALGETVDIVRVTSTLASFDELLDTDRKTGWLRLVEKSP